MLGQVGVLYPNFVTHYMVVLMNDHWYDMYAQSVNLLSAFVVPLLLDAKHYSTLGTCSISYLNGFT
jgi:hypothetical protein